MLAKRKKPRIKEGPQTDFPRHRKFVRSRVCIVPHCDRDEPMECCHVRVGLPANTPSWARPGIARKPHDAFTFSACRFHHAFQHAIGEPEFERRYRVNLLKEALDLARNSPCPEVRAFLKEYGL